MSFFRLFLFEVCVVRGGFLVVVLFGVGAVVGLTRVVVVVVVRGAYVGRSRLTRPANEGNCSANRFVSTSFDWTWTGALRAVFFLDCFSDRLLSVVVGLPERRLRKGLRWVKWRWDYKLQYTMPFTLTRALIKIIFGDQRNYSPREVAIRVNEKITVIRSRNQPAKSKSNTLYMSNCRPGLNQFKSLLSCSSRGILYFLNFEQ